MNKNSMAGTLIEFREIGRSGKPKGCGSPNTRNDGWYFVKGGKFSGVDGPYPTKEAAQTAAECWIEFINTSRALLCKNNEADDSNECHLGQEGNEHNE